MIDRLQNRCGGRFIEPLPRLEKIRNLWNIFDPSVEEKPFNPSDYMNELRNSAKQGSKLAFTGHKALLDDFIRYQKHVTTNEPKMVLGKHTNSRLVNNLISKCNIATTHAAS